MRTTKPLIVVALALLGAGCGSAGPGSNTDHSSAHGPAAAAFRYADCMRAHGVANYPDPRVSTSPGRVAIAMVAPASLAGSPHFKSAQHACRGIMPAPGNTPTPEQPGQKAAFLAFARCLRDHGLSEFPDPNSQGRLTPTMLSAAGVDLRSRQFERDALGCVSVTHGLITAAQVAQAASGAH